MGEEKKPKEDLKYLVRIANTDLIGKKQALYALTKIKGVNKMLANCLCVLAKIDKKAKVGALPDAQVNRLNEILQSPVESGVPLWMLNRRRDPETNEPRHILGPTMKFVQETDIKMMKKAKSYKGMRHARGLPVRGQRTKSNFRKSKSRGKGSLGVKRSKVKGK